MATALDVNKAEALIQSVVESNSLSDFWNPSVDKVTYYILNELFDFIEKKSLSAAAVKPSITLLCGRNTDSIVKNVFNLKRKVKNYLKKNSQAVHSVYKELYYADLDDSVSDSNANVPSANIIGDYCLGLGIDENIVNSCFSETSHKCFK